MDIGCQNSAVVSSVYVRRMGISLEGCITFLLSM
jgi:hypothetical protein